MAGKLTPTERLQARWPGWEISVSPLKSGGWEWFANIARIEEGFTWEAWTAGHDRASEEDACAAADRALKAIREAVT